MSNEKSPHRLHIQFIRLLLRKKKVPIKHLLNKFNLLARWKNYTVNLIFNKCIDTLIINNYNKNKKLSSQENYNNRKQAAT